MLGPPPSVRLHDDSRPHWPDHFGRCLPLPEQLLIEPQSVVSGVWLGQQQAREAWPYVDTRPPPPSMESPRSSDVRFLGPSNPPPPSDIRFCVRSHIPFVPRHTGGVRGGAQEDAGEIGDVGKDAQGAGGGWGRGPGWMSTRTPRKTRQRLWILDGARPAPTRMAPISPG